MKKLVLAVIVLSLSVSPLLSISADLDGDGRKETAVYKNGLLVVKDDDGKIVMMEKIEEDLTPKESIPMKQQGVYWNILKWPMLEIIWIYTESIGVSGHFSDIYTISWGPREKPCIVKFAITNFAESYNRTEDIDSDGAEEIIVYCDCLMNPTHWEANLVKRDFPDIQNSLSEAEQGRFPYVIDFEPSSLLPYIWDLNQIGKSRNMLEEWFNGCFVVMKRLQRNGDNVARQKVQSLVISLLDEVVQSKFIYDNVFTPSELAGFEYISKIKGCGILDSYISSSPLRFICSPGFYKGKYLVLDGSDISSIVILDHLNFYKWKSGDSFSALCRFTSSIGDTFSFNVEKEDTFHLAMTNTKGYVKRVYFRLDKIK